MLSVVAVVLTALISLYPLVNVSLTTQAVYKKGLFVVPVPLENVVKEPPLD
jgi:hypothetical protein